MSNMNKTDNPFEEALKEMITEFNPQSLKKFYVSYVQDAGMFMTCHSIIEAPDLNYAKSNWVKLIGAKGFACNPAGSEPYEYEELFMVPQDKQDLPESKLLEIYNG